MQNSNRLLGIDMAYAISLIGIVFYLFVFNTSKLAIQQGVLSHSWYILFLDIFPAMFFFLNGMTISLTMRDRKVSSRKLLAYLPKRGMIMMLIGFAVCIYWPMNVFIASGIMYFSAPYIIQWNNMILRILIVFTIALGHSLLFIHVPNSINFSVPEIRGGGLIDLTGFLFFNGYFSIIPWFAFFISGILFGRSELRVRGWFPPSSIIAVAFIAMGIILQVTLQKLDNSFLELTRFDNPLINIKLLLPAFVLVAVGVSILVVNLGNFLLREFEIKFMLRAVTILTSMKYSVLLFQLIISSTIMVLTPGAFFANKFILLAFSLFAGLFTLYLPFVWNKRISNKGPLEWVFKRVSGSTKK